MSVTSRLAGRLPEGAVVAAIHLAYQRAEPELRRLDDICGRGGVMVDVGAWYGPWAARLAQRAARVVAFEPTPLHQVLKRRLPSNVEVIAAAASDQRGEAQLWLAGTGTGAEGLSSFHKRGVHAVSARVPKIPVDELDLTGVTFIKIDVDGHEVPVLHGAEKTIRRDGPPLLIEVEARIQPIESIVGLLRDWGYTGWVLDARIWRPLDGFDLEGRQAATQNVADRGLFRTALWPYPRYLNSVLFRRGDSPPNAVQTDRQADRQAAGRAARPAARPTKDQK